MKFEFLENIKNIKLKSVFQHMDVLKPGGVSWGSKTMDGTRFLSRKQEQDVSDSQGMAVPILRSEVQEARGSGSSPLFLF